MPSRLRQLRQRIQEALLKPLDPALERKRSRPAYWLRLGLHIARKWARDRCPQQAALLAFQTALSLVPLIAVCFALLSATNLLAAESALADFIARHVLPVSGRKTVAQLIAFSKNVSTGALGVVGVASTVALAYMLFHTMENLFNDIWGVRNRRSLLGKFTVFYPLATLSPLLMGVSLYYTARFWRAPGILGFFAPMLSTFLGFTLANKLLPKTRVSWRAAMAGAVVSVILFEAAKRGFSFYVDQVAFKSFKGIYGGLGLVPLLLIWIYYTWLVTLFGAEVAYTAQNMPAIEAAERKLLHAATAAEELARKLNGRVAARLVLAVTENFVAGNKALPREDLVERFRLPEETIEAVFSRLKDDDIVVEIFGDVSGYMPARPLDEIRLHEILDAFEGDSLPPGEDPLQRVLDRIAEHREALLTQLTLADLVRQGPEAASAPEHAPETGAPEHGVAASAPEPAPNSTSPQAPPAAHTEPVASEGASADADDGDGDQDAETDAEIAPGDTPR